MDNENIEIQDEITEVLNEEVQAPEVDETELNEVDEGKEPAPEEQPRRNRVSASQRIGQMRRKLGDEQRLNSDLMKRLEALEAGTAKSQELKKPVEDDFSTNDEYTSAAERYHEEDKKAYAARAIKEDIVRREQDGAKAIQEIENKKVNERWAAQVNEAVKTDPNFKAIEDELIEDIKDLNADHLFGDILACENGAKIVNSLHGDFSKLEEIAKLSHRAASKEIWKLDIKLSANKKQGKTPPPPTREARPSGGGVPRGYKKTESQADYNRRMNGFS